MNKLFTLFMMIALTISVLAQAPQKMSYQAVIRSSNGQLVASHAVGMKISILQGSSTGTAVYVETQTPTTNTNGLATIEIGSGNVVTGAFGGINWATGVYYIKTETDPAGGINYTITGTSQILSVPYALYARTAGNGSLWSPGGSNIYFNSGNIGIGTSTPVTLIHAHGSPVASRGQLSLSSPAGKDIFLSFYEDNTFKSYLWFNIADQDLRLQNFTAGDLNLNPYGGKVGIGTNTPGATLEVAGTVKFTGKLDMQNQNISTMADPVNPQDAANKAYVDALKHQISALGDILIANGSLTASDPDGNKYAVLKIGSQMWFATNLRTTKYNDGTLIPLVTDHTTWGSLSLPAYCWYNNDLATYGNTYGALYNWYTVNTGKLCPKGWHVPNLADWTELTDFLGGKSLAGGKLKEAGTTHWLTPNTGATNESSFTALPGGDHDKNNGYTNIGNSGNWWSATQSATYPERAWSQYLHRNYADIYSFEGDKQQGYSVRCVKD